MPERTVTIASRSGLHARPAALFVKAAADQGVPVRIRLGDGKAVPAASMLAVLSLGAGPGAKVTAVASVGTAFRSGSKTKASSSRSTGSWPKPSPRA